MKKAISDVFSLLTPVCALLCFVALDAKAADAIVVDHNCTQLTAIPASAIATAKASLNIAYGHTSHGSQLTTGMTGLVSWKGDLYAWNDTGDDGALQLHDYYGSFGGSSADDLGSPDRTTWASATETYLKANTSVNVIIWSWCGEVDGTEAEIAQYLSQMSALETEFPNVKFVYMTGHLTGTGASGNVNLRNEQIRTYCKNNGKILYDFADIESYDPDGAVNYMALGAYDSCEYDPESVGWSTANWAQDWQNSHPENVYWYDCESAHSEPVNANRKAYAAWYLWARLAGWNGDSSACDTEKPSAPANLDATISGELAYLSWDASTDDTGVEGYYVCRNGVLLGSVSGGAAAYTDSGLVDGVAYCYKVAAYDVAGNVSDLSSPWSVDSSLGWSDFENAGSGDGWYDSWYGWFYNSDDFGGWIYSSVHGYQYVWDGSTTGSMYLWDSTSGAWWWTCEAFYPALYDYKSAKWYCYWKGAGDARIFWDYADGDSVSIWNL
jgi:hypothetical protein